MRTMRAASSPALELLFSGGGRTAPAERNHPRPSCCRVNERHSPRRERMQYRSAAVRCNVAARERVTSTPLRGPAASRSFTSGRVRPGRGRRRTILDTMRSLTLASRTRHLLSRRVPLPTMRQGAAFFVCRFPSASARHHRTRFSPRRACSPGGPSRGRERLRADLARRRRQWDARVLFDQFG